MNQPRLLPRQAVPDLAVATVGGGQWTFAERPAERFWMLVFYRGLHCPVCRKYLGELERLLPDFALRGVRVLALSCDTAERAGDAKRGWGLAGMDVGHGLSIAEARRWGLFVSTTRGKTSLGIVEPAEFSEPGLFLVRADRTLYWSAVQTMPFARPHFADILGAIDFVIDKDYPARGEA